MQVLGVYKEDLVEPMAHILNNLGVKKAMVVYGTDGLDEISASAPTKVCELRNGQYKTYEITPEQFGMTSCAKEDLVGGTAKENAQITKDILSGKETGPKRNAVVLNSAAGLYLAEDTISFAEAVKQAEELIDSGKAIAQLEKVISMTNE
jgi:anthranilate phosphoribosyltransferase